MSLMTALKIRPVDEIVALLASIAKNTAAAAGWRVDLAAIPAKLDSAIVAEDHVTADALEASKTTLQRSLRKAELELPDLQRQLFEAQERKKDRFIAEARKQAVLDFVDVKKSLRGLLAASKTAEDNLATACEKLGTNVALLHITNVSCPGLNEGKVDHFVGAIEEALGQRERHRPVVTGIAIRIIAPVRGYQVGDEATLPDAQAHSVVKERRAEYVYPEKVTIPTFACEAPCPTPNERGYVQVKILRMVQGFPILPREEVGGWAPGEIVGLPSAQATKYVRTGFAVFIPNVESAA